MAGDLVKLEDLTVEVRDRNLVKVGQIIARDLEGEFLPVFNNVGNWKLKLPAEHPMVPYLRAPGAGIIVTRKRDTLLGGEAGYGLGAYGEGVYGEGVYGFGEGDALIIFSGPVSEPTFESTPEDFGGTVTFTGVSDEHNLADRLAWPQPSNSNPSTQTVSHDVRTGPAETLIHQYVSANLGPAAPASRRVTGLVMGIDYGRGPVITRKARFDDLGAFIQEIALIAGLGFRLVQVDDELRFETFDVKDFTQTIRLDIRNGQLSGQKVTIAPPGATRVIVAGQEEGVNRQFIEVTTPASLDAEDEWGRRIEVYKDQRNTDVVDELTDAGKEILAESGFTGVDVQVVPVEDTTMEFGYNWALGDRVSVVVENQELPAIATGMVLRVGTEGLKMAVVLGSVTGYDRRKTITKALIDVDKRLSRIEKNVELPDNIVVANDLGNVVVAGGVQAAGNIEADGAIVADGVQLPYAFAAGQATVPSGGSVAVTLPAGRFLVPPIVTVSFVEPSMPGVVKQAYHTAPTTSGFTIFAHTTAALGGAAATVQWTAIQMTSASASG